MTTLALVRHAKSAWDDPDLSDHDRPLNARGVADAPRMARNLADSGFTVDVILTSTAVRARTTAAEFAAALGVPLEEVADLYGSSPQTIVDIVTARGADRVMVVAHDPGLSMLAHHLAPEIPHMPTCAVATFTWAEPTWQEAWAVKPHEHTYAIPRES